MKTSAKPKRKRRTSRKTAVAPIAPPAELAAGTGYRDCLPSSVVSTFRAELDGLMSPEVKTRLADLPDDALGLFVRWRVADVAGVRAPAKLVERLGLFDAVMRPLLADADEKLADMDGVGILGGDPLRMHHYWSSILARQLTDGAQWQRALLVLEDWNGIPGAALDGVPSGPLRNVFERLRVIAGEVYQVARETVWAGAATLAAETADNKNRVKGRTGGKLKTKQAAAEALRIIEYARSRKCSIDDALKGAGTDVFKPHASGDTGAADKKLRRWADYIRKEKIVEDLPQLGKLAESSDSAWRGVKAAIARRFGI